ncbi:MAG TPA: metallophosphoesterase family protein [Gaiellaceae bacterium]|nr:metallophosphoesterase family protein [Gaiellaceae bacterium]
MRVGLISDVHGNCLALDAVLAELEQEPLDSIVCLGDVAAGPQPRESIARVRGLGCPVVMGNWDAAFISGEMPPAADPVSEKVNEIHAWWGEQLTDDDRAYLQTFVPQLEDALGTDSLCFHGSPRSYDDWIFTTTSDEELEAMFPETHSPLLVGGHTHVQMLRRWERSLIVNPGSVGLAFLGGWPHQVSVAPWAEYAIVTAEDGRLHVDMRRTTFDVAALLELSRSSGMPHAEWWAGCWVLEGATRARPSRT